MIWMFANKPEPVRAGDEAAVYVRIRISDRETRYIPWNLLLPWQARFLCRDSEYFSGQCVSNTFRNWLTINTVTNSLTRTCSSYCHTWPESPDSSKWYSASWLKHNFKVVQTVLRIRIRVNTVRTDLNPPLFYRIRIRSDTYRFFFRIRSNVYWPSPSFWPYPVWYWPCEPDPVPTQY